MLDAVVTSVPATGSNWLTQQLLPYFGQHSHVRDVLDGKADDDARVAFTHYAISNVTADEILEVSRGVPLWTPLRDPLLSITTWLGQGHPGKDIPNRLRGWKDLAYVDSRRAVIYTPVDIPGRAAAVCKENGIYANQKHVFNSFPERVKHAHRRARALALKEAYACRDHTYVPSWLWRELRELEEPLRPILERAGYKDLMWWA